MDLMGRYENRVYLKAELGSLPVSSFSVIPDLVTGFEPKPLRKWPVLLLFPGKYFFDLERFVRGHS